MSTAKSSLRSRLVTELKTTAGISLYLALFLAAITTYRRLLLAAYQVNDLHVFHYGYNLMEALVLAKVIVFGSVFQVGERFRHRPLIVPTLYKTFCFSLLVLTFSIGEHIISGWLHGKATGVVVNEIRNLGVWEIVSRVLVVSLAFVPLFAVWETGRVLGEGRLFKLFFTRRAEEPAATAN